MTSSYGRTPADVRGWPVDPAARQALREYLEALPQDSENVPHGLTGSDLDFTGADLSGLDLSSAEFGETLLSGVRLAGADLSYAWLIGATLHGADLTARSAPPSAPPICGRYGLRTAVSQAPLGVSMAR